MYSKTIPRYSPSLKIQDYVRFPYQLFFSKTSPDNLERSFKPLLGDKKIIHLPTGRHALWHFLEIVNLPKGSEVLVSAYNFYVIVRILIQKELKPVFVDIQKDTLCIDPEDLRKKISKKSKLVIVTHMFGNPADVPNIKKICQKYNLLLFEDCAHAIGTCQNNKNVGSRGDGALFSFGIYKNINSFGGGMLALPKNQENYADSIEYGTTGIKSITENIMRAAASLTLHPIPYSYFFLPAVDILNLTIPNFSKLIDPSKNDINYRFDPYSRSSFKPFMVDMIQSQLKRLEKENKKRKRIVQQIKSNLSEIKQIKFLDEDKFGNSNLTYFGIYVPDSHTLYNYLKKYNIISHPNEYYDCSSLKQFSKYSSKNPQAKYASEHLLRIPNYTSLRPREVNYIISTIRSFYLP